MNVKLALTLLAGGVLAAAARGEAGELNAVFNFNLSADGRGFTLGGRVDGPGGPAGATVNGRLRPDGVAVEGRVEERGRAWDFELDASAKDGLRATARRAPQRI